MELRIVDVTLEQRNNYMNLIVDFNEPWVSEHFVVASTENLIQVFNRIAAHAAECNRYLGQLNHLGELELDEDFFPDVVRDNQGILAARYQQGYDDGYQEGYDEGKRDNADF